MKASSTTTRATEAELAARARILLIVSVVLTLGLYVVPYGQYVAYPLLLVSTLVHELGHGVAALLMGADFEKFVMHWDGSGVAHWRGHVGNAGRAFISAGGLVGPAVGAAICFVAARRASTARYTLGAIGGLLLIAEVAVVRNQFGLLFVGVLAVICLGVALRGGVQLVQLVLVFLAVQLALSVYSRGDYLFTKEAMTAAGAMPSDVQHMAEALVLPYWFWGALCGLFSLAVVAFGGWYMVRAHQKKAASLPPGRLPG